MLHVCMPNVYMLHVCMPHVYICHMCEGIHGDQKRASDAQDLGLQLTMSQLVWVLATKLRSPTRTSQCLNL